MGMNKKKVMAGLLSLTVALSTFLPGVPAMASGTSQGDFSPFEDQVNETLATLSLRHRASLMQGGIEGEVGQDKWYHHQTKAIPHMNIPFLNMANGPMGVNNTPATSPVGGTHTSFGSGLILAATWNEELVEEAGRVMGEEARAKDVALFEAPAFNINRDLTGGRVFEYYSEDPYLTARTAVPYVKGVQSQNVAANIKHFMANNQEDNRNNHSSNMSERAMHEIYLPAFQAAVEEADAWSLMTAANRANGVYTSDNRYLLTNLLRYEWGFDGVALTDWCGTRTNTIAAKAGLDLSMPGRATGVYHWSNLLKEVEAGRLSEDVISGAAQNMLRLFYRTGVLGDVEMPKGSINTPEHQAVERQVAEEGIVLLKNEAAQGSQESILPLNKSEVKSIAVLGPLHSTRFYRPGPGGSGATNPPYEVSYLQGIQKAVEGTDIQLNVPAYTYNPANAYAPTEAEKAEIQKSIDAAVAAAKESEVAVIVAGLKNGMPNTSYPEPDTESGDRDDLDFPPEQLQLIQAVAAVNPNTVVIVSGSVVELTDFIDMVPGVFQAFYPGQEYGNAMADLLFGVKNPSGRMPHSIPERFEDTVGYVYRDLKNQNINYDEGVYVGYRWHNLEDKADALFPFGFGLSYTTFEYSNPKVSASSMKPGETVTVSVDVENTGSVAGKEVVQLYINDVASTIDRPVRELKGFEKIELQPGEKQTVSFEIDQSALSYWDEEVHSWMAEAGEFKAQFCSDSATVTEEVSFTLSEDTLPDERYQVVQAEGGAMTDSTATAVGSEGENWSGTGYVTFQGKGSTGTFNVNVDKAGTYSLIFKYSNPNPGNAQSTVEVNGEKIDVIYGQPTCYVQNGAQVKDIWNYDSVDVTLKEGDNTVKLTADVMAFDLDSIIVQDVDYVVTTPEPAPDTPDPEPPKPDLDSFDGFAIEAEDPSVVITDGVIAKNHSGYKGTGFYDPDRDKYGTIEWTAQIPETDEYTVAFRYTSLGGRACDLYIDGVKAQSYKFYTDGNLQNEAWETWLTEGYQFQLTEGEHTFKLVNTTKNGPNIDRMLISRDGTVYEAEEGTMSKDTTKQSNRDGFTGTGFADFGGAGSYFEVDIAVETFSPYDIEVRYAVSGDARPCIVYVDGKEVGRLNMTPTGTGNDGWSTWKTETLKDITLSTDNKKLKIASVGAGPNIDRVVIRGGMQTSDNVAPTVMTSTPAANAKDVPVNQTITLGFSEDVVASSAFDSITLKDASGAAVELNKSVNNRTLTLDPAADLKEGTVYTLTMPDKAVKDAAGNDLAQAYTLTFTTAGEAPAPTEYTVTFAAGEGSGSMDSVKVAEGGSYTLPESTFTAPEGKRFKAWSVNGEEKAVGATITVTGDVTVTAIWETIPVTEYTVTFAAGEGSGSMESVKVAEGGSYTLPESTFTAPEGKQFKAWSVNGEEKAVGDTITVTGDVTVTAVWEDVPVDSYTVTFMSNGSAVETAVVAEGETVAKPADPTLDGWYFDGWYTDEDCTAAYDFAAPVTGNLTLYAKWIVITPSYERYAITLEESENGSVVASARYSREGNPITLTVKADEGYVLDAITVTAANGDEVKLTEKGENKYTFQMPECKVSVKATFVKEGEEPVEEDLFSDVAEDAWYFNAVAYAVDKGFMAGVTEDTFAPDATLTRAQLSQMLYALEGAPEVTGESAFTDVAESAWYAKAVNWAVENKLVSGYGDGTFGPDDALTREQLCAILYAYAKGEGAEMDGKADLSKFTDIDTLSPWAEVSMAWAVDAGLVGGMEDGTLAPAGTATRAQMAQIMMNLLEKVL